MTIGMWNRGAAIGLSICLIIGLTGCGKQNVDNTVGRTQEEARAEVRRHLEQEPSGKPENEENGRQENNDDRENNGENAGNQERNEKKSELARAAAEEALRRESSAGRQDYDDSSSDRRGDDDFRSGERKSDGTFQVDCISFELPEGWEKDEYWSDSYDIVFAPGGDADLAADCLIISQVTEAFGMIDMFLENMDEMTEILEEEIAEEEEEYRVTIDDIGMTFLGHTLKMEAFVRDEEEAGAIVLYFAEDDTNLYSIYAYTMLEDNEDSDRKEGVSAQLEEALRMFFDTGRVVDRRL